MAVVIGSERNIKVTSEDNSTKSQGPAFHCSPADQVGILDGCGDLKGQAVKKKVEHDMVNNDLGPARPQFKFL